MSMKKFLAAAFALGMFLVDNAMAADLPAIDRTDKVSPRRYLDSLNVYNRRPIRINQSGFRPQDYKYAYVADPSEMTFKVIDASTGKEVSGGGYLSLIKEKAVKPNIWINGAFNSMASVYEFGSQDSVSSATEALYRADFTSLSTQGEYYLVVGKDTSATFWVHPSIYNSILENSLQFFGIQRCGNTKSHFHGPCHLKDGSAIGHDLTGGWHDCGDHFKVSETLGYTAYVLSMVYLTYQDKAEDRYGNSYDDTVFTDGIPDILYEAHIGTDYILKLYEASKADGLLDKGDMYHSVGVDEVDHAYWDVPEKQDAQVPTKGGPDRVVLTGIGTNTAGMFAAALANVSVGYRPFDPVYADTLLEAAKEIYEKVVKYTYENYAAAGNGGRNTSFPGFYTGGGPLYDDAAAAALALWYATADTSYRYDLYKNPNINNNETNYKYNLEYFKGGYLGHISGFTAGGWASDYQNVHSYVLFGFKKLILDDKGMAETIYGLSPLEQDSLNMRVMATFNKAINDATNEGDSVAIEVPGIQGGDPHSATTYVHVISPYNLLWVSFDWGVIRYNMGTAVAVFLMYELTKDERYLKVSLDNMYYALGANPWDISFLMGAGDKNPQHPHNRAANPDGYNAGSMPYEYRCPKGALMGGREPTKTLIEDWSKYTSTETCIDFSAQFLFPAQSLAETLPIDIEGPLYSNIAGTPITDTSAIISWDANEIALTTVFYNTTPDASTAKSVAQTKATKGGALTIGGLEMGKTYYFYLEGMDTKRNMTTDDNHGQWYQFTMVPATTTISGVTICQVDNRSAKIYWWSSDRMNGVVNYGTSSTLGQAQAAEGGAVLFHEATLTGLSAGTTYYFSVSSGATTDDNGGSFYSFTTEEYATTVDMDIYMKPLNKNGCSNSSDWKQCNTFLVIVTNNDTMDYKDLDLRVYFPVAVTGGSDNRSIWDGTGQSIGWPTMTFDTPVAYNVTSAKGTQETGYYTNIHIEGDLKVSGSYFFEFKVNPSYGSLENSWSLRPHTDPDDPEQFPGIDLTKGPKYVQESNSTMYIETIDGKKEVAYTRTPYITAHYHGKYIYGYGPDYTPETGPQSIRKVDLTFESPFVTPYYSVEKVEAATKYLGHSTVTPTGLLDDFEMNGTSVFDRTMYDPANRKDGLIFGMDTVLAYGNNYIEWVSWHNHGANLSGSYDCACAVVRSNVEIDTITTPPEIRYLEFTRDTISAYTGKMAEVHVKLLDSLLKPILTERVTLQISSENGLAKFFAASDATVGSGDGFKVDIVDGEAVFYVSADVAMETLLRAVGPNTTTMHYNNTPAVLQINDLPPWPIIDYARMVDVNCDGVPDAIDIMLSNEYVAEQQQSFNSIQFVYNGDTLTSTKINAQNGKQLQVGIELTDNSVNTSPSGSITLISNVAGKQEAATDFYQDGISPRLTSVSVLERLDTATSDRVYLQFSETIQTPGLEWPLKIMSSDNAITVKNVKIYNDSLNVWEYEIDFAADGQSLVTEGMKVQLLKTSNISDMAGNGLGECEPEILTVLLKIRPYPINYASIADNDQDGLAEYVNIEFSQALDTRHTPDSVSIIFGSATPETLWVKGSDLSLESDNIHAHITLKPAFALGNTNGNYEGVLNGKSLVGAGLVVQHLGTGAAYESNNSLAEDKAGPVFTSASLQSATLKTTTINISEPVVIRDSSMTLFQRERDDLDVNRFNVYRWTVSTSALNAIDTSEKFIMDGDRVRFAPQTQSAFVDASGNMPATNNPWVVVGGTGDPEITFNIYMRDNLARVNTAVGSATEDDPTMRLLILNPTTKKFDVVDTKTGLVIQQGLDTNVTPLTGALWVFDLTVPRGGAFNESPAWSELKFNYDMPIYTNLGGFVNRITGTYNITPNYLSGNSNVTMLVEWTNVNGMGVRSQEGRAVGTGAYIYKVDIDTKFIANTEKDAKTRERFSTGDSYNKTKTFGLKRYSQTN